MSTSKPGTRARLKGLGSLLCTVSYIEVIAGIEYLEPKMVVNPAEIRMLQECLLNLDYLIEKIPDPECKQFLRSITGDTILYFWRAR
jgi:hypothetical protein